MYNLSVATMAHYQLPTPLLAEGWRVTRVDAQVFGWSTNDIDRTIDGIIYRASEGLATTSAHSTDTLAVDTMDVTAFLDVSTEAEIAAGVWDGAECVNFEYIWSSLPSALNSDVKIKRCATLGEITRQNNVFTAEIRGMAHKFTTRIGRYDSALCPWYHAKWSGSTFVTSVECNLDLTGRIHTGSVTSVGAFPSLEFSNSAQAQGATYFNTGFLAATSGDNAGLVREVRRYENKKFSLLRPFPYAMAVSDTFTAVQGDDHRYHTCLTVLNNLNPVGGGGFGGTGPWVPGQSFIYRLPV